MRVLVTGGSGFIGSHVVDRLLSEGHTPRILDLESSPYHRYGEIETHLGSVTDPEACKRALDGCDAVIHLAAVADVAEVETDPRRAEEVNVRGTLTVLEAAAGAGVRRVVYGSSIWIYSDCPHQEVDESTPIPPPGHFYTATKLAGELYCRSYADSAGLDCSIVRLGIPYGPRARPATVVAAFTEQAASGQPLTLAGGGAQSRAFVYVEDLAEGIVRCLLHGGDGRVYNLAGARNVTIVEVAEAVRRAVGEAEIVHVPGRAGDFSGKQVSTELARHQLGWAPRTPLAEGVRRYVEWRIGSRSGRPRVLILSSDIGEGHDAPARALRDELAAERPEARVEIVDGLAAMGRAVSAVVRDGSWLLFRRMRWLFDLQYALVARVPPTRWLARNLLYLLGRRAILRLVREREADLVISTYPGVTAVLGELRRRGRLQVPVYSSITDLAGLQFWAHRGVDMHFVTHPESIAEVEEIAGKGSVRWARPPTSSAFFEHRSRPEARTALGLPGTEPIVLVSGGGWGIGDLEGAIRTALELEGVTVACLVGRNDEARATLERRFGEESRVRVVGFTDRMSDFLAAADVLVHSTAGLTVLEAQIRGCHVISYGFPVGHIRLNDEAYRRFGLAETPRSRRELAAALRRCLASRRAPDPSFARLPSTASLVLGDLRPGRRSQVWRLRLVRAATAAAALVLAGLWPLHR